MTISPRPTWTTMFRAISEIAVATRVASVREKPSFVASILPCARAGTMSASEAIGTRISSSILGVPLSPSVEHPERFVEIERRVERLEVEVELHHRDRDVRLDPDDDCPGAAQSRGHRDRAERPRHERVDDVQGSNVDDEAASAVPSDAVGEIVSESEDLAVAEVGLNRGDQVVALSKYRDQHFGLRSGFGLVRHGRPVARAVPNQAIRFLETALEIPDRPHHAQVDAEVDERLSDLRRETRDDRARAHESCCLDGLDEVVRDRQVDPGHAGDVDYHDARPVGLDRAQQLLGELARPRRVEDADDRENEQALPDLENRCRELVNRLLLLPDHPFAL